MDTIAKTLLKFGLTDSDVRIYLRLNEAGESDGTALMEKTALSRTTLYDALNTLTDRGLVTFRKLGRSVLYKTTHPQQLQALIDEKKLADEELERNMKAGIHSLMQSYNLASNQPGTYSFMGKEGIKRVYDELLADRQNIDSIEDQGQMETFIGDYAKEFIKKRVASKIFNRVIAPANNELNRSSTEELREARHVDPKQFPFEMDIRINDTRVALTTFHHETAIGIVIIHPEIVKNYKIFFNWLWRLPIFTK